MVTLMLVILSGKWLAVLRRKEIHLDPRRRYYAKECYKPKVDGNKRQPNDASRVHCKANVFGFVESGRDFPSEHGVHRAQHNEKNGIGESLQT